MNRRTDPRLSKLAQARQASRGADAVRGMPVRTGGLAPSGRERVALTPEQRKAIESAGLNPSLRGGRSARDAAGALQELIEAGVLAREEVTAFLRQKLPNQEWSQGLWGDDDKRRASQLAADQAVGVPGRSEPLAPEDVAEAVARSSSDVATGLTAPGLEQLPDEYDAAAIEEVLRVLTANLTSQIRSVATGQALDVPPQSINGDALAPASVSTSSLDPVELGEDTCPVDGPELAIRIEASRSASLDLDLLNAGSVGPGRIWDASTVYPEGWKLGKQSARYRVLPAGLELGVIGVELADGPVVRVRYGAVLSGVQAAFNRAPRAIEHPMSLAQAPVSFDPQLATLAATSWPTDRFYHDQANGLFVTGAFPSFEVFGSSALTPTAAEVASCTGLSVSLITGRTALEVWTQLNSRTSAYGRKFIGEGSGPGVVYPSGEVRPPSVPTVVTWNGSTGYTMQAEGYGAEADTRMVQGYPFGWSECEALTASDSSFSLVLEAQFFHTLPVSGTWPSPAHWSETGLRIPVDADDREWAFDVVVT